MHSGDSEEIIMPNNQEKEEEENLVINILQCYKMSNRF
jgi:hypothetical protein